jgi:hypothetical protein
VDLFGRLVCPSCQQIHPVWSARPAVPRDRPEGRPVGGTRSQVGRHRLTYGGSAERVQRWIMPPSAGRTHR